MFPAAEISSASVALRATQHGVAALLERAPRENANVLGVLDDENCLSGRRQLALVDRGPSSPPTSNSAAGSVMVNVVPRPSALSTAIVPPD